MRTLVGVLAVLALVAAPALAGDGNVPRGTLATMGLSGLKTMSDAQGTQIRGMGAIAFTTGTSSAVAPIGTASASSSYTALGFGPVAAGAAGNSSSAANFTVLATPVVGTDASTASAATAFGF